MYPSVIMSCNISPETIGSRRQRIPEDSDEPEYLRKYDGHKITLEDTVVQFSSVMSGICADSVLFAVNKRTEVRKSDPLLASSLKVAANSMFGLLGYPHSNIQSIMCICHYHGCQVLLNCVNSCIPNAQLPNNI